MGLEGWYFLVDLVKGKRRRGEVRRRKKDRTRQESGKAYFVLNRSNFLVLEPLVLERVTIRIRAT